VYCFQKMHHPWKFMKFSNKYMNFVHRAAEHWTKQDVADFLSLYFTQFPCFSTSRNWGHCKIAFRLKCFKIIIIGPIIWGSVAGLSRWLSPDGERDYIRAVFSHSIHNRCPQYFKV
jgi:hypothetical protein